ncbi:tyrosine-type recombinase/integrase [Mesorhizobium japonicum]|uniref:tyrosine-type recombinase/integrase n=1 Tax=Mesorhizobium japonicum TaxID=2066070 RepID=UPI0005C8FC16
MDLPILDELFDVLRLLPADRMLFLTHTGDRPYKPTTFGNWFHDQCIAAGLPHCASHGLRKAGATRLANAGATELEIMAYLGHRTPDEARTDVKKLNRKLLGDTGMEKVASKKRTRFVQPGCTVGHSSPQGIERKGKLDEGGTPTGNLTPVTAVKALPVG